jgi:hypothetical protein
MNLILIALIALGLYAYRNKVAAAVASGLPLGAGAPGAAPAAGYALIGPNSDPSRWYQGIKPGTVTVGGSPAGADWQPSHATQTGLAIAGSAIGGTLGVASMAGSTIFAAGTTAGLALGAATLGIGLAATVVGMIYAHHAAALAAEGKALNSADPRALQSMALVLQAVLAGEITSVGTAQEHLDQIVNDWYGDHADFMYQFSKRLDQARLWPNLIFCRYCGTEVSWRQPVVSRLPLGDRLRPTFSFCSLTTPPPFVRLQPVVRRIGFD